MAFRTLIVFAILFLSCVRGYSVGTKNNIVGFGLVAKESIGTGLRPGSAGTLLGRRRRRRRLDDGVSTALMSSWWKSMVDEHDARANEDDVDVETPRRHRVGGSRRELFASSFVAAAASFATVTVMPSVATAGLLDEYGTDPSKIISPSKPKVDVPSPPSTATKGDNAIDPTLRASYYYPTAKKRYLPRIQKVSAEITRVPDYILQGDWASVSEFGKTAENAILPLQLYQSSLDGQGLGMSNSYARQMKEDAANYEKSYKTFVKAVDKKNVDLAITAITDMGVAIADYRQVGRLKDDDGFIPSVDEMRRMAMRRPTVSTEATSINN